MSGLRKNIRKYELFLLLFFTNAISMVMELIAARILSPVFGSSNIVWTVIISMMLFANGAGNYLGGVFSDKYDLDRLKVFLLLLSGVSTLIIAVINSLVFGSYGTIYSETEHNAAIAVVMLLMIPCTSIGMLSPVINKAQLRDSDNIGIKSGIIYAVITAGGLFGTLIGGLVLIPAFGCSTLLFAIAGSLSLISCAYLVTEKKKSVIAFIAVVNAIVVAVSIPGMFELIRINSDKGDIIVVDTNESYVRIYDDRMYGEPIRMFNISGGFSSACYKDESKRDELVFAYTKAYDMVLEKKDNAYSYCMIGGAGYSYPRYLISHFPDKTMDVVEIDEGITEAAKKYFYLQDFIDEYGTDRLRLYNDDGRLFLAESGRTYDVILNDAFTGDIPARSLSTREAAVIIKNSLAPDGVYASNVLSETSDKFLKSEIKTLMAVFKYVWAIDIASGNWLVIASDKDYGFDSEITDLSDSVIFTDDYAPVDYFSKVK
ncbi:MAG: fused MFS/spermidine synthase [Ruminiclostridium sp.]|nr:fused MFS/spermidine synthase [Ruminiclostridium sp.]